MDVWKFNKGEWTEAYVFLKILGDGRIYGADQQLHKDPMTYMDIVNIIRDEPDRYLRFERLMRNEVEAIEAYDSDVCFKIITARELRYKASRLYRDIMALSAKGAGAIPTAEAYLKDLHLAGPKARISREACEKYGAKTDIIITAQSNIDNATTTTGFSIKSHLGSSATLFNSSQTSGFLYRINGCTDEGMHIINSISSSFVKSLKYIRDNYSMSYIGCRNEMFSDNLSLVDSKMDEIMQCAILASLGYYDNNTPKKIQDVCHSIIDINPLRHRRPEIFYPFKFKEFLFDSFAGMTATNSWNGRKLLTGGYIDVSPEGELLYYRAMSDDVFESYLFKHTYIDMPDRGINSAMAILKGKTTLENREPTEEEINEIKYTRNCNLRAKKSDWGYVYKNNEDYLLAINFQVRFK